MLKHLLKIAAVLSLAATQAQALPIVQADAFTAGDNKAALETSTGLTWLDFGITTNKSLIQVESELNTVYAGWRLPTEAEVFHLWNDLFSSLTNWDPNKYGNGFGGNDFFTVNPNDSIMDIISIIGVNMDVEFDYTDDNGVLKHLSQYVTESNFRRDDGLTAMAYFAQTIDTGDTYPSFSRALTCCGGAYYDDSFRALWISTLLVRSSALEVPEPSSILLMGLGLLGLGLFRRQVR